MLVLDIPEIAQTDETLSLEDRGSKVKHRQSQLAAEFRRLMTDNQGYSTTNGYRRAFYAKVLDYANKVSIVITLSFLPTHLILSAVYVRPPDRKGWG